MPPTKSCRSLLVAAIAAVCACTAPDTATRTTVIAKSAIAHDTSARLAPPDDEAEAEDQRAATRESPSGNQPDVVQETLIAPAGAAAIEQRTHGNTSPLQLVASFDGLGYGFDGPQGTGRGGNPSDNSLAVGPDHIVQTVNGHGIAIFTKRGAKFDTTGRVLYGPVNMRTLFRGFGGNCEARSSGDVVVRYDQLANRWLVVMPLFSRGPARDDQPLPNAIRGVAERSVVGQANQPGAAALLPHPPRDTTTPATGRGATPPALNNTSPTSSPGPYSMCYAVSTSPDPLGTWYRYEFLRAYFPDYPRPAVWPDGWYIPTSTSDNRISDSVATQRHACVADRNRMLRGEAATEQCVIVENMNFLNNADLDGTQLPPRGAPNIMMAAGGRQLDRIFVDSVVRVWSFHVDWDNPARTRVTELAPIKVAPYRFLCDGQLTPCVPQPGSARRLDSQGDKIMARMVYRRIGNTESIVAVHSVNTAAGSGGVRWYEFRVNKQRGVSLHQQGTFAPDSVFRWMASPAMDRFGNIGIGYSYGDASTFVGQRFAGRLATDRPGVLTFRERVVAEGEAPENGRGGAGAQRWEDYTQTAIDPSDDCTIWYVGDYVKRGATSYSTRIASVRFPQCGRR